MSILDGPCVCGWGGPGPCLTARQVIEARLGRSLGPIDTMPEDERRALYLLALQLQRRPK